LLDTGARLVERLGEEGLRVLLVGLVRDHRGNAASPRCGAIGLAGIALVAQRGARRDVGPYVEQGLEAGCVGNLAAGQIERDDVARIVGLGVDFGREPAARAAERLALLPPFAPAAETWARTTVESNIWIKWADPLIAANVSKKASNTPALLSRSKRFHTEFQGPKRSGSARQRTFSTVKKCIASRNNRSSAALRPRRGRQARKTSSAFAQVGTAAQRGGKADAEPILRSATKMKR